MALLSLPVGCQFFPSPQELLREYLRLKNSSNTDFAGLNRDSLIKELNLYDYAPFHLPEITCFRYGNGNRKRHWFCYTSSDAKEENTEGWRRSEGGYWKRKGDAVEVAGFGGVLGTQTTFEFYRGNSMANAVRTRWCMHEYALPENVRASFVLCRVFNKSLAGNGASEKILSSRAEESGSTVFNIYAGENNNIYTGENNNIIYTGENNFYAAGVKVTPDIAEVKGVKVAPDTAEVKVTPDTAEVKVTPDTAEVKVTPDTAEVKVHGDNSGDGKNDELGFPSRLNGKPDNPAMTAAVYAFSLQTAPRLLSSELVMSEELTPMLLCIQEEDFIELDDLVSDDSAQN